MKSLIRNILINAVALSILPIILDGVEIVGGLTTLLFAGFIFYLMSLILRPILNLLALPFNVLTFGSFSFLINIGILYLLTIFVTQISISPFTFQGASFAGFVIPRIYLNTLFAYAVSAFTLSLIIGFIDWLFSR